MKFNCVIKNGCTGSNPRPRNFQRKQNTKLVCIRWTEYFRFQLKASRYILGHVKSSKQLLWSVDGCFYQGIISTGLIYLLLPFSHSTVQTQ